MTLFGSRIDISCLVSLGISSHQNAPSLKGRSLQGALFADRSQESVIPFRIGVANLETTRATATATDKSI
jgi:hypothetical protein